MSKRDMLHAIVHSYGTVPDVTYFSGDMDAARAYFDYMQVAGDAPFLVDDATWDDLSMDAVFKRLNLGLSNAGEQYLYYLLRAPALTAEESERRKAVIDLMEQDHALREKVHYQMAELGRRSNVNIFDLFAPEGASVGNLILYGSLVLAFLGSLLLAAATQTPGFLMMAILLVTVNSLIHHQRKAALTWQINTLQYCAAMAATLKKLCALKFEALRPYLREGEASLAGLKGLRGVGGSTTADALAELVSSVLFIDLIAYERQKNLLARHQKDFLTLHETLGNLDAAICVASYRKSVPVSTAPKIDFEATAPYLSCEEAVHPLIAPCISNSVDMRASILLTGSNASGKTTFLRTLAINLILAQGVCTALCTEFRCTPMRVLSSIDVRDNLLTGDSYYVSELKSLHKIVDAAQEAGCPVFCCLDEIFRGTNAVERIAASAEILTYLEKRCLCAAATHDVELCAILKKFSLYHFEERIEDGEMYFDYQLKPGYSKTSNAIKLLELMGFPADVVERAQRRADAMIKDNLKLGDK